MSYTNVPEMDRLIEAGTELSYDHLQAIYSLVRIRQAKGMTQQEIADALGEELEDIRSFEMGEFVDIESSFVRKYALMIGAKITTHVTSL